VRQDPNYDGGDDGGEREREGNDDGGRHDR